MFVMCVCVVCGGGGVGGRYKMYVIFHVPFWYELELQTSIQLLVALN